MIKPDKWVILKFINNEAGETFYKVLASFRGGYLDADTWRLNSGITKIEETEDTYEVHGYSGSVYSCSKYRHGLDVVIDGVAASLIQQAEETNGKVKVERVELSETMNLTFGE